MNNFEKIKAMSIDEMAIFFHTKFFDCLCEVCTSKIKGYCHAKFQDKSCRIGVKQWLESESEGE